MKRDFVPFLTFMTNSKGTEWKFTTGLNYLGDKCKVLNRLGLD